MPPETCDDENHVNGDGCSADCKQEVERIYWCCEWNDSQKKASVKRLKKTQTLLQTIFLVPADIDPCPGSKLIIGREEAGWTDTRAQEMCARKFVTTSSAPTIEAGVTASAAVGEEGCSTSLLGNITGAIQSILSFMSFGLVEKPVPCE